jgi:hypothetical protein
LQELGNGTSALYKSDQNENNGDHEQDMDEAAKSVRRDEAEGPENQQNDRDGDKHTDEFIR